MLGCAAQGVAMEILSVWILAIGRIAVGVTAGVDGTIQAALIEKCSGKDQKNFYLGATLLAMSLGLMLGPAFAALFIDEKASALTWSLPFFIMAALFAVSAAILCFSMKEPAAAKSRKLSQIGLARRPARPPQTYGLREIQETYCDILPKPSWRGRVFCGRTSCIGIFRRILPEGNRGVPFCGGNFLRRGLCIFWADAP